LKDTLHAYYALTKPGIIYSNVLAAIAGFFLASRGHINLGILIGVAIGVAGVIASACVFNNYLDRSVDKKMERTRKRALVTGRISGRNALIYASVLGVIGFVVLAVLTNLLTVLLGVTAIIFYVIIYGIAKRQSVHGTIVGSISGALPPVAGYVAVTNQFDLAAALLVVIWVTWQMPHFYAIAMYRRDDYANAGIPVLAVKKGFQISKYQIISYVVLFVFASLAMTAFHYTGIIYFIVMALVSVGWLSLGVAGFRDTNDRKWARKMFFYSLVVMLVLCLMLSVGAVIA
jgi:protoheme IX farnesyltransferase